MHTGSSIPKVSLKMFLDKALLEITKKNLGITLVIDKTKVVGIFTDGDLRRCINKKIDIHNTKIDQVMTKKFHLLYQVQELPLFLFIPQKVHMEI